MTDNIKAALICAVLAVALIGGWVLVSHFEARTFSKLTGREVSTWDAMWVSLRVQDGAIK